jgi:hypothetical protein
MRADIAGDGIKEGMQLVQWIVPLAEGGFSVLFSPVWTEELPASAVSRAKGARGRIRRRSAPLTSRWLPHPIALAESEDTPRVEGPPQQRPVCVRFAFATSERGPPVSMMRDDDISFAALFAEMVRVVADLCESAALPVLAIAPDVERRGLSLTLGSLVMLPVQSAYDALCVLRVAVELCAQQRGFLVSDATLVVGTGEALEQAPLDARAAPLFGSTGASSSKGRT